MRTWPLLGLLGCLIGTMPANAAETAPEKGTVHFRPAADQANIPDRYRLEEHDFDYALTLHRQLRISGVTVYRLQFPSAVTTPCQENNTVHAEYYRPQGKGPFPGVIVLDITAGDQTVSRTIATHLAR